MPAIVPTIGRKVWYYGGDDPASEQDATVINVFPATNLITAYVINRLGYAYTAHGIPLMQDGEPDPSPADAPGGYCRWMPYQIKTAQVPT